MKRIISLFLALITLVGMMSSQGIAALAHDYYKYPKYKEWANGTVYCPTGSSNGNSDSDCDYYTFNVPATGKLTIYAHGYSETRPKYEMWVSLFQKNENDNSATRIGDYMTVPYQELNAEGSRLTKSFIVTKSQYTVCLAAGYYGLEQYYTLRIAYRPATPKLKLPATRKRYVKTKWNRINGVTGYVLQYSRYKNFKKKKTVVTYSELDTTKYIARLRRGKRYYFRVRSFVETENGNYYSKWSKRKSIVCK